MGNRALLRTLTRKRMRLTLDLLSWQTENLKSIQYGEHRGVGFVFVFQKNAAKILATRLVELFAILGILRTSFHSQDGDGLA